MASCVGEEKVGRARVNNNKAIYSWGANSYGQLSRGDREDQLIPREITLPVAIQCVTGGGGHTLAISDRGQLWTCGSNNKGQLGLGTTEDVSTLSLVPGLKDVVIATVAGGWDFTLAVTENGTLYVWGSNSFGQLGDPNLPAKCQEPMKLSVGGEQLSKVAAGLRHSVALTVSGEVWCWGHGKKGQCGILVNGQPPAKLTTPTKVAMPEECGRIVDTVAGSYHTAALTEQGQVVVWGCNKYGQSTQDPLQSSQVSCPYLVKQQLFADCPVKQLGSGWTHLVADTGSPAVLTWGRADYGQLGRSHERSCDHIPSPVETSIGLKHFICGSEHTLAVSAEDCLVAWGWNEHGICGTGDEENVLFPRQVAALATETVSLIGCGAGHCFTVTCKQDNYDEDNS